MASYVKKGRKARKASKNRPAVEATPDITKTVAKKVRIGGKGGISEKKYKTLQQYYGNAIRENASDLEGMIKAWSAVYYHSISTYSMPQHDFCPQGVGSWYKFQRAKAFGLPQPAHLSDDDTKRLIPLRLAKYIKALFDRLCSQMLARCVLGATQNQTERQREAAESITYAPGLLVEDDT